VIRILGTTRFFPYSPEFPADRLRAQLTFRQIGKFSAPQSGKALLSHLKDLPAGPMVAESDRLRVDLPQFNTIDYKFRPSAINAHDVSRTRPLECWQELLARVNRFGRPVQIGGGTRLELLNVKTVITDPVPDPAESLAEYGFDSDRFAKYQQDILQPELPAGLTYTYGNRMRGYDADGRPAYDALQTAGDLLAANPSTRHAYIDLWDTKTDMENVGSVPCLTTVFFRVSDNRLTLTATYRAHNLLVAWMQNVYGLMAIQRFVAQRAGMATGSITVISHSLGIDPDSPRYSIGRAIAERWDSDDDIDPETGRHILRSDPNGYFVITVDHEQGLIIAEHRYEGLLLKGYRADRAAKIQRQIAGDLAISVISHAIWVGRELQRAEQTLYEHKKKQLRP
jgi:thymidylate synthase